MNYADNRQISLSLPLKFAFVYLLYYAILYSYVFYFLVNKTSQSENNDNLFISPVILKSYFPDTIIYGVVYFFIVFHLSDRYRCIGRVNSNIGFAISTIFCLFIYVFNVYIKNIIDDFIGNDSVLSQVIKLGLSASIPIVMLVGLFYVFKSTHKQYSNGISSKYCPVKQQPNAAIFSALLLCVSILPITFIHTSKIEFAFNVINGKEMDVFILIAPVFLMIHVVISYAIIYFSIRKEFYKLTYPLSWWKLVIALLLAVIFTVIIYVVFAAVSICFMLHCSSNVFSDYVITLLLLLLYYAVLALSALMAVYSIFGGKSLGINSGNND